MSIRKRWPKGAWMRLKSSDILRAVMQHERISLGDLAHFSGCSKGFISHLLAGRRTSCTPELAERIARCLDTPLEVLFDLRVSPATGTENKSGSVAA